MKNVTKFTSADKSQTLTIVAAQGKRGFNVKASVKTGKGKGQPKAVTGCREVFKTAKEAEGAVAKLGAEAIKQGWSKLAVSVKNAFTVIPAPAKVAKSA